MTLKENIYDFVRESSHAELITRDIEDIADDFAIGFAEWIRNMRFGNYHAHSTKELLEIYKKEKQL